MALIVDPDNLNQGVEVTINATAKTIKLNKAGNLSDDGVTLKCLYSFIKEEWKNDSNLIKYPFPFIPITDESFEVVNGWNFADNATRYLIRTAGWSVVNTSGAVTERWAGVIGLGTVLGSEQPYFYQGSGTSATDFQLTGQVNQAIQVYSDPNGDGNLADGFDRRSYLDLFVRTQGRTYAYSNLAAIGVSSLSPQAYRFPLSTAADLKVAASDATIASSAPYTGMSITYFATPQAKSIGGTSYNFGVVVDGGSGTAEEIYTFVQYQLRQTGDIDAGAGSVTGKTAAGLMQFIGDNLETITTTNPAGGGTGVYLDEYLTADTNRISFTDNTGVKRTEPFLSVATLQFNSNLVSDPDAIYRVFFTSGFGTNGALLVNDKTGNPVSGTVGGSNSIQFTFDYDGNTQGGRTPGTDANITVVAIGLGTGQYVSATGTIARSTQNSVSLVAPLERNYQNP